LIGREKTEWGGVFVRKKVCFCRNPSHSEKPISKLSERLSYFDSVLENTEEEKYDGGKRD